MGNIKKLLVVPFGIFILSNTSSASMLDQLVYNVMGQATNAAGARIGDEIYYGSSGSSSKSSSRKHKKRAPAKRNHAPKMTDAMRVQKSLSSLGFYRGKIDGQVNSFETRSAIKKMNIAYGISNGSSLKPEAKDTLIFLGTLFGFDRHLISTSNNKRNKNRKIQVGLKLHGYYQGNIDGAIGKGTRGSIAQYKSDNGMKYSGSLDFEEEYQLISSAKEKNDRNIEESIASLEAMGRPVQQYAPVPAQVQAAQAYQNVQAQQVQRVQYQQPQMAQHQQVQMPVAGQQQLSQTKFAMPAQVSVGNRQQDVTMANTPQVASAPVQNTQIQTQVSPQ